MSDPLAQIVSLLQLNAAFSKLVEGAGRWRVRRAEAGQLFYCVVLDGACRLQSEDQAPIVLQPGDFVLIPSATAFTVSSIEQIPPSRGDSVPIEIGPGLFRLGKQEDPADVRLLLGYCDFGSTDAALLVKLLPALIHVRDEARMTVLVQLVNEETRAERPGSEPILTRLVEILLIEALRLTSSGKAPAGLLRGLADNRLAVALRQMHADPTRQWTIAELATEAALSRSTFFDRFRDAIGISPMEYLLAWRMALAKDMIRRKVAGMSEIATRVGYSSASTFSVAFARHVGLPPTAYAREQAAR